MAYPPKIFKNIVDPHIVTVLNTEISNVNIASCSLASPSLSYGLPTLTGHNIPFCECVIFLDAVE